MDQPLAMKKPRISEKSRIFKKREPAGSSKTKDKGKQAVRSRNTGKLATLMDITLDVFFEIVTHLRPIDLLQLCRVSKHFRTTFMSKSARTLWVAARKNADVLPVPDPLPGMSEPHFAAFLFENNCSACGAGRTARVKTDFAIGFRFCAACRKANMKPGYVLLRDTKDTSCYLTQLLPTTLDSYEDSEEDSEEETMSLTPELQRLGGYYYIPEFEAVEEQYCALEGQEAIDEFTKRRTEHVASVAKAARAISKWEDDCRAVHTQAENALRDKRMDSIREKLYSLGYTQEDLPGEADWRWTMESEWNRIVRQPKELTPRIWSNIEGKLRKALEDLKQARVTRAADQRKFERETQLRQLYIQWLQITDPKDGPYPTIEEFLLLPEVLSIRDGNMPLIVIDQDLFDEVIGPAINLFAASLRATVAKALRVELYGGDEEDTDKDSDDILYYATSLFTTPNLSMFNFRASELISFDELLLKLPQHSRGVAGTRSRIRDAYAGPERVFKIGTARAILKVLGLPESTPYDEVTGKIVCLCGKPGFIQPTSFADLVMHVVGERNHCRKMNNIIAVAKSKGSNSRTTQYDYIDDHDPQSDKCCFKLLAEGEEFSPVLPEPEDTDEPMSEDASEDGDVVLKYCKICEDFTGHGAYGYSRVAMSMGELKWHVETKHLKEFHHEDDVHEIRLTVRVG